MYIHICISTCDFAVLMWKIERVKYINYTEVQRAVTKVGENKGEEYTHYGT